MTHPKLAVCYLCKGKFKGKTGLSTHLRMKHGFDAKRSDELAAYCLAKKALKPARKIAPMYRPARDPDDFDLIDTSDRWQQ